MSYSKTNTAYTLQNVLLRDFPAGSLLSCEDLSVIIPPYQRAYCWEVSHIQKLFNDIDDLRYMNDSNEYDDTQYYLGSICFQLSHDGNELFLLDGQQRLTSLLIFGWVLYKQIYNSSENNLSLKKLCPTLAQWPKIIEKFQFRQQQSQKHIKIVETLLSNNYSTLNKIENEIEQLEKGKISLYLSSLRQDVQRFEFLLKNGAFSLTILNHRKEAEQFFQGENNRGVTMSLADLVKAYHMRHIDENEIQNAQVVWDRMISKSNPSQYGIGQSSEYLPKLLFSALLIPRGGWIHDQPWDNPKNINDLKGMLTTIHRNRLVDIKVNIQNPDAPLDLSGAIIPGIHFFKLLNYVDALFDAVTQATPINNDKYVQNRGDLRYLWRFALVFWADRFMKIKSNDFDKANTVKDWTDNSEMKNIFKQALQTDVAFFEYYLFTRSVFGLIQNTYGSLLRSTVSSLLMLSSPTHSPLLLPYRTATPIECKVEWEKYLDNKIYKSMKWYKHSEFQDIWRLYREKSIIIFDEENGKIKNEYKIKK